MRKTFFVVLLSLLMLSSCDHEYGYTYEVTNDEFE